MSTNEWEPGSPKIFQILKIFKVKMTEQGLSEANKLGVKKIFSKFSLNE